MATENTEVKVEGFPDAAAHNAEVAQKLAAQDIMGHNNAPRDTGDASGALDALAKQAEEDAKKKAETAPEKKEDETVTPAKTDAEIAAEKEAAERAEADRKRADELFKDSPGLPAGASPKSSESFAAIKVKAAQEISKLQAELEKIRADKATLEESAKNQAPPEALKELEDHRAWRAKLDIEADPKWKEFDKAVTSTQEFIYAQLRESPKMTPEIIAEIKKHGGPENVKMDSVFAFVDDKDLQRTIEAKIADIKQKKFEKSQAIEVAKTNISEYIADRQKSAAAQMTNHNTATEKHLAEITKKLDWYNPKTVDPKADEPTRKSVEAHNSFIATTKTQLQAALQDDSPEMRAILIAAAAQLFYLQPAHKTATAELEALKKTHADVVAKYDKLRNGSVSRLRDSNAPADARPAAVKDSDRFTQSAGEALDNLRKQVTEERARADK